MISKAISETRRILRLTRKPKWTEYNETLKVCGAGIVIIGFIGFAIFLLFQVMQRTGQ
jgi:protein transport protein SEC61 subunit gamma and related proteins